MTDIVWQLRLVDPNQVLLAAPPFDTSYLPAGLLCHEAANEIERLREEVQVLRLYGNKDCTAMADEAMKERKP